MTTEQMDNSDEYWRQRLEEPMQDPHADDCPGIPVRGETFDSYPISYAYKCSVCGKDLPNPDHLTWPTWKA